MSTHILFLCPHAAAKSLLAASYLRQAVAQHKLAVEVDSAGTEPDEQAAPLVVEMLRGEGIDVSAHQPRPVSAADLRRADRIISLGCIGEELDAIEPGISTRLETWGDVPMMSQNPSGSRAAIRAHIDQLVKELL